MSKNTEQALADLRRLGLEKRQAEIIVMAIKSGGIKNIKFIKEK